MFYDYELPKELIALYPEKKRSDARLLVVDRQTGQLKHRIFRDITEYFEPGDLLVLNNTKVFPARLFGKRPTGGCVETLLLKQIEENVWEMLVKPSRRIKKGVRILFGENGLRLEGEVLDDPDGKTGIRRIRFAKGGAEKLNQIGHIPLPPYIRRADEAMDREMYQTVFAEKEGAVASPTAGLHFDEALMAALKEKGVEICFVTLHVGYGTFRSVEVEDLSQHKMDEEEFEITEKAARQIETAQKGNRRIIACGTTVVRTLETAVSPLTLRSPPKEERIGVRGKTRLFIYPPYEFKRVNAMMTNFHVPRTTLLMLVAAFGGSELISHAYEAAIRERYRFYSYGDAMLII